MKQHTLRAAYNFTGKGLHTGRPATIHLLPAPDDYGVVFQRTDLGQEVFVHPIVENVSRTNRSTTLSENGADIITPEHLLSALMGLKIDNVLVQMDAPEVPILDGSARPFVEAILRDGLLEQREERRFYTVNRHVEYEDSRSDARIVIDPAEGPEFDVTIDFSSKVLGVQQAHYDESIRYEDEIAPCRTFCFFQEVEFLLKRGLIKGGDLDNALVIDEPRGYLGDKKLYFENECARHKLLDLIGDFALLGMPLKGRVTAYKPGHRTNTGAVAALKRINQ